MANPLYTQLGQNMPDVGGFFQRLNQLKQMVKGDPQQQIQNLLNSGKVSQEQYNRAVKTAQNIQKIMNTKS